MMQEAGVIHRNPNPLPHVIPHFKRPAAYAWLLIGRTQVKIFPHTQGSTADTAQQTLSPSSMEIQVKVDAIPSATGKIGNRRIRFGNK